MPNSINVDFSVFNAESGVTNGGGKNASLYKAEIFRDANGLKYDKATTRKIRNSLRETLANCLRQFAGLKQAKSKNIDKFLQMFLQWYSQTFAVTDFTIKSVTNSTETAQSKILASLMQEAQKYNEKAKIIC